MIAAVDRTGGKEVALAAAPLPDWSRGNDQAKGTDLAKVLGVGEGEKVTIAAVEALPSDPVVVNTLSEEGKPTATFAYAKADLVAAFKGADSDKDGTVTRAEWRVAQSHVWPPIWLWPAALSAVACVLFFLGGKEAKKDATAPAVG
jgi:hypothetical protein